MDVRLKQLRFKNFKGLTEFTFSPQGSDSTIRGDNATCKTSVADGWSWLLSGKDTRGRADFQIKPVDSNGAPYPGLDHLVEAVLSIDGKDKTLCKVYKEIWKKKRGHSQKTFGGHKVEPYIDGVPVKQKEWQKELDALFPEETVRILTDPHYLAGTNWYRRREIVFEVCGDVSFDEVVASNAELADLPNVLGDRDAQAHKKVLNGRMKQINDRLGEIPARIDELQGSMGSPAHSQEWLDVQIKELQQRLDSLRTGGRKDELRRKKSEIEGRLSELQSEAYRAFQRSYQEQQDYLESLRRDRREKANRNSTVHDEIARLDSVIQTKNQQKTDLREQYFKVYREKPDSEENVCPTCGQALPEEQVKEALEKFNEDKSNRMAQIQSDGRALQEQIEDKSSGREKLRIEAEELDKAIAVLDQEIGAEEQGLPSYDSWLAESSYDSLIREIQEELKEVEASLEQADQEEDDGTQAEIDRINQQLEEYRQEKATLQSNDKNRARVEELRQEEKDLAAEHEELQRQLYLVEQFSFSKANLMEDRVNSFFELAQFRLFHQNLDGGIEDTCEVMVNGVPYGSLNSASRINAGLDIIRTLSRHYGLSVPVFVDHVESVTQLFNPGTQQIRLVVDPNHKTLEVTHG